MTSVGAPCAPRGLEEEAWLGPPNELSGRPPVLQVSLVVDRAVEQARRRRAVSRCLVIGITLCYALFVFFSFFWDVLVIWGPVEAKFD